MAVAQQDAQRALDILRTQPLGRDSAIIGTVTEEPVGKVVLTTAMGGRRFVTMLAGEQLPRIC